LNYRKDNPVLQNGEMKQFIPYDGIYVYFRYNKTKKVMVVANNNVTDKTLELNRFDEMLGSNSQISAKDIVTGKNFVFSTTMNIPSKTVLILGIN